MASYTSYINGGGLPSELVMVLVMVLVALGEGCWSIKERRNWR